MNLLILALCFCLAAAYDNAQLIDDLEKILSEDSNSPVDTHNHPDLSILNKVDELEAQLPEPFQDSGETQKRGFRFGKCLDGITPADGPNMEGCPEKLCYDLKTGACSRLLGRFKTRDERNAFCRLPNRKKYFKGRCDYSCGFCKSLSPTLECRKKYGHAAPYGCCPDGLPALKPDKSDCMACVDMTPHACRQFNINLYGERCGTNSYRIRTFLHTRCAKLCGRCGCKYSE